MPISTFCLYQILFCSKANGVLDDDTEKQEATKPCFTTQDTCYSETSVDFIKGYTALQPEDRTLHNYSCRNIRPQTLAVFTPTSHTKLYSHRKLQKLQFITLN
jgi:hypothetical protein